ncbi:MAG: hypothetical protein ABI779_02110 [Acidobacteriota bacterium]
MEEVDATPAQPRRAGVQVSSLGDFEVPAATPTLETSVRAAGGATASGQLDIKCVRLPSLLKKRDHEPSRSREAADATKELPTSQCLYMSADMQRIFEQPIRNRPERNRIVFLLMDISDANCATFLHRFYATKAGWDAAHGTGKDIATAVAAGTAAMASGFSAAVGLFNLAGGTAIENIDKSFYSEKALQAITASIKSLRASSKKRLLDASDKGIGTYSYFEALNDLQNYDHDCSLQRGVEQLAELANNASIVAEAKLNDTRTSNVAELKRDLESARTERDEAVRLRTESQQQLIQAKDDAERQALQAQIRTLTEQVKKATGDVDKLRAALPTGDAAKKEPSSPVDVKPSEPGGQQ